MTRPGDQEGQAIGPGFDVPSSPPNLHGAGHALQDGDRSGNPNSDDTLPDTNCKEVEVQQGSLRNRVEETQFEMLECETQQFDEAEPASQNPANLSQQVTPDTRTNAGRPMSPFSFSDIERPQDSDPADAESFKFGKAQKAKFAFTNPPWKTTEANNTRSPSSSSTSKQVALLQAPSSSQLVLLPPLALENEPLWQSGNIKTAFHSIHETNFGPPMNIYTLPPPAAQRMNENDPEPSQQRVAKTIETNDALMPKSAPSLQLPARVAKSSFDRPGPCETGSRAANKSNKRSGMKQAFPPFQDVLQPPHCRSPKAAMPTVNQQGATVASNSLQSTEINSEPCDRVTTKQKVLPREKKLDGQDDISEAVETALHRRGSQPSAFSFSHSSARISQLGDLGGKLDHEASLGIQEGIMLPPVVNRHQHESQEARSPILDQREYALSHQCREEILEELDTHSPHISHAHLLRQAERDDHRQLRPPSRPPSRPLSLLSNTTRPMVRPILAREFAPQDPIVPFKQPTKVQKPNSISIHVRQRVRSDPHHISQRSNPTSAVSSIQTFRQSFTQVEQALQDYENQKTLIELQEADLESQAAALESQKKDLELRQIELGSRQTEIKKLQDSALESKKTIKLLQEEKAALTTKVEKFKEISTRYKAHMNDVVVAQKHLMAESFEIKKASAKIREESKAILTAQTDRQGYEDRLRILINKAKEFRPSVEKLEELEKENDQYKIEIENAGRTNALLQSELNVNMVNLGRERHNAEQLQKHMKEQTGSHKELVQSLKKAQSTILDELTKKGSVLASLVNSENSMQAKIDEIANFIYAVNSREPDLPLALIKLIQDTYTRIENKLQAKENADIVLNGSSLKLFEDIKERISQLRLDEESKNSFNKRISELRDSNAILTSSKSAQDQKCHGLSKRIDEMELQLSGCDDQLRMKMDELAALRALPKEDPLLIRRIHDLENTRMILQGQLDTANQEWSKAKEELDPCHDMILSAQEQSQNLQGKLTEAENFLKTLQEEKKEYLATHKADIDEARQEVAKSASASKVEMQMKHDSVAKNLEQARSEAENALSHVQKELQKCQEERASYSNKLNKAQEELTAYKKQLTQQAVYNKCVDRRHSNGDEFDRRESNLQQALKNLEDMKAHFNDVQNEISSKLEKSLSPQQQTEKLFQRLVSLEKEVSILEEEKSEIRKIYEVFRSSVSRFLRRNCILGSQSVDEFVAAIPIRSPPRMVPPAVPMPKFGINRPSSASFDLTPSHTYVSDDQTFSSSFSRTAEEALQHNMRYNEQIQGGSIRCTASLQHENDVTPRTNSRTNSRMTARTPVLSTTKAILESAMYFSAQSPSPYQAISKPLRPAHRKPSGLAQSSQIEQLPATSQGAGAPASAHNCVSGTASEYSVIAQTPIGRTHSSTGSTAPPSSNKPTSSTKVRVSAPDPAFNRTEGLSKSSQTLNDTSLLGVSLLTASSALSELSEVDQVGFNDDEIEEAYIQSIQSKSRRQESNGNNKLLTPVQTSTANTVSGVHFTTAPSSYQFSDDDTLSGLKSAKTARPPKPSLNEESVRRRHFKPLKSAMRAGNKKKQTTKTGNDAEGDIYEIPKSTIVVKISQKPYSLATTINKQLTQGRKGSIGSSYNRIVSGSKPDSINHDSSMSSTTQQKFVDCPIVNNSEKSPMMRAPARMARKRSASMCELTSQPVKLSKQARVSFPNQGRRTNRTSIRDSQEAINYRS